MNSQYWAALGRAIYRLWNQCPVPAVMALLLVLGGAAAAVDRHKSAPSSWAPPDLDQVSAVADVATPCALGEVLQRASQRVQDLVLNMQRFSATEEVEFDEVDRQGVLRPSKNASFSYVAYIYESSQQQLVVEEYRDDTVAVQKFPSKLATIGTAAFALIFHPDFLKDYAVTCEGLSDWRGRRAWRLHLTQLRPNNFRHYRVHNRSYAVMLKARAWIDAETFEVLRLETDLREPIPQIPLMLEHVIVDYATVEFPRRNLRLWLPRAADIYMDCLGHQYHHQHSFSHFQLFWVDTEEKVKASQMAASEPSYPAANTTGSNLTPSFNGDDVGPDRAAIELSSPPTNITASVLKPTAKRDDGKRHDHFPKQRIVSKAEAAEADGEFRQGLIFHQGRNYSGAAEWYRKAAERGLAMAQNNLAVLYAQGQGVPQDYVMAHMFFTVAANAKPDRNKTNLELLESRMTPDQIDESQRRAKDWIKDHPTSY